MVTATFYEYAAHVHSRRLLVAALVDSLAINTLLLFRRVQIAKVALSALVVG